MFQTFKKHPLYFRKEQSARLLAKYSDRVPVIVEKHSTASIKLNKHKFMVPKDSTVGSFIHILRNQVQLSEKEAIFLMCNTSIPPTYELMSTIYERHKDEDGFLYTIVLNENTFGLE